MYMQYMEEEIETFVIYKALSLILTIKLLQGYYYSMMCHDGRMHDISNIAGFE